jgi:hypothetical protein
MAHTACLFCLVSTVSGFCENAHGGGRASCEHTTKLEQFRYCFYIYGSTTMLLLLVKEYGTTTNSLMTFSIKTLNIKGLYVTISINDTEHSLPQHNTLGIKLSVVMLNVALYLLLC